MISFFVQGIPSPGGSKKFIGMNRGTGRALIIDAGGKKTKDWRKVVAMVGKAEMTRLSLPPQIGPLKVTIHFFVPRPKYHLTSKGVLTASANRQPITKPDATKLLRSTEDALTGICWVDDAQIVIQHVEKRYAEASGQSGALVVIESL